MSNRMNVNETFRIAAKQNKETELCKRRGHPETAKSSNNKMPWECKRMCTAHNSQSMTQKGFATNDLAEAALTCHQLRRNSGSRRHRHGSFFAVVVGLRVIIAQGFRQKPLSSYA